MKDSSFSKPLKLTALVTAMVFLLTSVLRTDTVLAAPIVSPAALISIPEHLEIPSALGTIQEERIHPGAKSLVVFIQDAHAVLDAQSNIQGLIEYLSQKYGIRLVGLEGGKGRLDSTLLRTFPDEAVKKKILASYLEKGELTGPGMAAIFSHHDASYVGIEDWELYQRNYLAYLRAARKQNAVLKDIAGREKLLDAERPRVFSKELNQFYEELNQFRGDEIHLLEFLDYLKRRIVKKGKRGIDLGPERYPELSKLFDSIEKEARLTGESLSAGVRKLAKSFRKKYSKQLARDKLMEFNSRYQDLLTGRMDAGVFLGYLTELAASLKVGLALTPVMKEVLKHEKTLATLKGTQLFDELENLIREIESRLAQKPEEQKLLEKYEGLRLLRGLSQLEVTREELERFQKNPQPYLSLMDHPEALEPAADFYEQALKRDEVLYQNLENLLRKERQFSATVVLGGFHRAGFERKLKEKMVSYCTIMPVMHSLRGNENYSRMMEAKLSYKGFLKTTFYDAFMRHAGLELIASLNEPDLRKALKLWRDSVLQNLADQGRLAHASEYTQYLDFLLKVYIEKFGTRHLTQKSREQILKDIEKELSSFREESLQGLWDRFQFQLSDFIQGFESLTQKKELSLKNVRSLLKKIGNARPSTLATALVNQIPGLGFDLPALRIFIEKGVVPDVVVAPRPLEPSQPVLPLATPEQFLDSLANLAGQRVNPSPDLVNSAPVTRLADQIAAIGKQKQTLGREVGTVAEDVVNRDLDRAVTEVVGNLPPKLRDEAAKPTVAAALGKALAKKMPPQNPIQNRLENISEPDFAGFAAQVKTIRERGQPLYLGHLATVFHIDLNEPDQSDRVFGILDTHGYNVGPFNTEHGGPLYAFEKDSMPNISEGASLGDPTKTQVSSPSAPAINGTINEKVGPQHDLEEVYENTLLLLQSGLETKNRDAYAEMLKIKDRLFSKDARAEAVGIYYRNVRAYGARDEQKGWYADLDPVAILSEEHEDHWQEFFRTKITGLYGYVKLLSHIDETAGKDYLEPAFESARIVFALKSLKAKLETGEWSREEVKQEFSRLRNAEESNERASSLGRIGKTGDESSQIPPVEPVTSSASVSDVTKKTEVAQPIEVSGSQGAAAGTDKEILTLSDEMQAVQKLPGIIEKITKVQDSLQAVEGIVRADLFPLIKGLSTLSRMSESGKASAEGRAYLPHAPPSITEESLLSLAANPSELISFLREQISGTTGQEPAAASMGKRYELVESKFDLRDYLGPDERVDQMILISDNSGTLTPAEVIPVGGDILAGLKTFTAKDRNFLVVNSGDPLASILEKAQRPVIDALSSASQRKQYQAVTDGGARSVYLDPQGNAVVENLVRNWPVKRRIAYARALTVAFYEEIKRRDGKFKEVLAEVSDREIGEARGAVLAQLDKIEREKTWKIPASGEKVYRFDIVPKDFIAKHGDILGEVFVYDVGPKVTLRVLRAPSDVFAADFFKTIASSIRESFDASEKRLRTAFGSASDNGFVDLTQITKAEAVERVLVERVFPKLDPKKKTLVFMIGDGSNDIPTFALHFPDQPNLVIVPVLLNRDALYAPLISENTWIGQNKLDGARAVIDFANQIKGKHASETPVLSLSKWQPAGVENSPQDLTARSFGIEDRKIRFLNASDQNPTIENLEPIFGWSGWNWIHEIMHSTLASIQKDIEGLDTESAHALKKAFEMIPKEPYPKREFFYFFETKSTEETPLLGAAFTKPGEEAVALNKELLRLAQFEFRNSRSTLYQTRLKQVLIHQLIHVGHGYDPQRDPEEEEWRTIKETGESFDGLELPDAHGEMHGVIYAYGITDENGMLKAVTEGYGRGNESDRAPLFSERDFNQARGLFPRLQLERIKKNAAAIARQNFSELTLGKVLDFLTNTNLADRLSGFPKNTGFRIVFRNDEWVQSIREVADLMAAASQVALRQVEEKLRLEREDGQVKESDEGLPLLPEIEKDLAEGRIQLAHGVTWVEKPEDLQKIGEVLKSELIRILRFLKPNQVEGESKYYDLADPLPNLEAGVKYESGPLHGTSNIQEGYFPGSLEIRARDPRTGKVYADKIFIKKTAHRSLGYDKDGMEEHDVVSWFLQKELGKILTHGLASGNINAEAAGNALRDRWLFSFVPRSDGSMYTFQPYVGDPPKPSTSYSNNTPVHLEKGNVWIFRKFVEGMKNLGYLGGDNVQDLNAPSSGISMDPGWYKTNGAFDAASINGNETFPFAAPAPTVVSAVSFGPGSGRPEQIKGASMGKSAEENTIAENTNRLQAVLDSGRGLIFSEDIDAIDRVLWDQAKESNTSYLRLTLRDETDLDWLKATVALKDGAISIRPGKLIELIKRGGILLIDYNRSGPKLVEGFNSLFDDAPYYESYRAASQLKVVGVMSDAQFEQYPISFYRRFRKKLELKLSFEDPLEAVRAPPEDFHGEELELYGSPLIRETLLGRYYLHPDGKIGLEEGALLKAIRNHQPLLIRGGDWQNTDLGHFIRQLLVKREIEFNGELIKLPEGFQIYRAESDYGKDITGKQITAPQEIDSDQEVWVINSENQDTLFAQTHISPEHKLTQLPGLLDQSSLRLRVTADLPDWVWHRIMHAQGEIEIHVQPGVRIPSVYRNLRSAKSLSARLEKKVKEWDQAKDEPVIWVEGEDADFIHAQIQAEFPDQIVLAYPVTQETTLDQLIASIEIDRSDEETPIFRSERKGIREALQSEGMVILAGLHNNPSLMRELEGVLQEDPYLVENGERIRLKDLPGKLVIVSKPQTGLSIEAANHVSMPPEDEKIGALIAKEFPHQWTAENYGNILKLREIFRSIPGPEKRGAYAKEISWSLSRLRLLYQYQQAEGNWLTAFEQVMIANYVEDPEVAAFMRTMVRIAFGVEDPELKENTIHGLKLKKILNKTVPPVEWDQYFWSFADTLSLDLLRRVDLGESFTDSKNRLLFSIIQEALVKKHAGTEREDFYRFKFNIEGDVSEAPVIDDETGQGRSAWEKQIESVKKALAISRAVMLKGSPGTGKSYVAEELIEELGYREDEVEGPVTVGMDIQEADLVTRRIYQDGRTQQVSEAVARWAERKTGGLLIVDEANLSQPAFWNFLRGFFAEEPYVWVNGRRILLNKDRHKIIFTGNQEYLEGREFQELITDFMITIPFQPFPKEFLRERVDRDYLSADKSNRVALRDLILELHGIFQRMNPAKEFSLRDVQELSDRVNLFIGRDWTQEEVVFLAWNQYRSVFDSEERLALQHILMKKFGVSIHEMERANIGKIQEEKASKYREAGVELVDSAAEMVATVNDFLAVREARLEGKSHIAGKRGMVFEGPSGRGKDVTLIQTLRQNGFVDAKEADASIPSHKRYYHLTASLNFDQIAAAIQQAQKEGALMIVSELNLLPSAWVDGKLNDLLTGRGAEGLAQGFAFFATINSVDFSGREKLSTALQNRVIYQRIEDYSQAELLQIAKAVRGSVSEKDVDQLVNFHAWVRENAGGVHRQPTTSELLNALDGMKRGSSFAEARDDVYGLIFLSRVLGGKALPSDQELADFKEKRSVDNTRVLQLVAGFTIPREKGPIAIKLDASDPKQAGGYYNMGDNSITLYAGAFSFGSKFDWMDVFDHETSHGATTRVFHGLTPGYGDSLEPLYQDLEDVRHEAAFKQLYPHSNLGRPSENEIRLRDIIKRKDTARLLAWLMQFENKLTLKNMFQYTLTAYARELFSKEEAAAFAEAVENMFPGNPIRLALNHLDRAREIARAIPTTPEEEEIQFQQYRALKLMQSMRDDFSKIPKDFKPPVKPPTKTNQEKSVQTSVARLQNQELLPPSPKALPDIEPVAEPVAQVSSAGTFPKQKISERLWLLWARWSYPMIKLVFARVVWNLISLKNLLTQWIAQAKRPVFIAVLLGGLGYGLFQLYLKFLASPAPSIISSLPPATIRVPSFTWHDAAAVLLAWFGLFLFRPWIEAFIYRWAWLVELEKKLGHFFESTFDRWPWLVKFFGFVFGRAGTMAHEESIPESEHALTITRQPILPSKVRLHFTEWLRSPYMIEVARELHHELVAAFDDFFNRKLEPSRLYGREGRLDVERFFTGDPSRSFIRSGGVEAAQPKEIVVAREVTSGVLDAIVQEIFAFLFENGFTVTVYDSPYSYVEEISTLSDLSNVLSQKTRVPREVIEQDLKGRKKPGEYVLVDFPDLQRRVEALYLYGLFKGAIHERERKAEGEIGTSELTAEEFERQIETAKAFLKKNQISEDALHIDRDSAGMSISIPNQSMPVELTDLESLTSLTYFSLEYVNSYAEVLDLTPLSHLTRLRSLKFHRVNLGDLSPLKNLSNLRSLFLPSAGNTIDLDLISEMSQLRELQLSFSRIKNFLSLQKLKNLTHLYLDFTGEHDLGPLKELRELEFLAVDDVVSGSIFGGDKSRAFDDFLREHPNRGKLLLRVWSSGVNYQERRYEPPELTFEEQPEAAKQFLRDNGLEESRLRPLGDGTFALSLSDTALTDLRPLENLTRLSELELRNTQVMDLEPLRNLTRLTDLGLSRTPVFSLQPLRRLTNLKRLNLYGTDVYNLEPISSLSNLVYLALNVTKVDDLSPLTGMTQLRELFIEGTNVTRKDIEILKQLPSLEFVNTRYTGIGMQEMRDLKSAKSNLRFPPLPVAHGFDELNDVEITPEVRRGILEAQDFLAQKGLPRDRMSPRKIRRSEDGRGIVEIELDLSSANTITNDDLTHVAKFTFLSGLNLNGNPQITDLKPLEPLANLRWLLLKGTGVSQGLPVLLLHQRQTDESLHLVMPDGSTARMSKGIETIPVQTTTPSWWSREWQIKKIMELLIDRDRVLEAVKKRFEEEGQSVAFDAVLKVVVSDLKIFDSVEAALKAKRLESLDSGTSLGIGHSELRSKETVASSLGKDRDKTRDATKLRTDGQWVARAASVVMPFFISTGLLSAYLPIKAAFAVNALFWAGFLLSISQVWKPEGVKKLNVSAASWINLLWQISLLGSMVMLSQQGITFFYYGGAVLMGVFLAFTSLPNFIYDLRRLTFAKDADANKRISKRLYQSLRQIIFVAVLIGIFAGSGFLAKQARGRIDEGERIYRLAQKKARLEKARNAYETALKERRERIEKVWSQLDTAFTRPTLAKVLLGKNFGEYVELLEREGSKAGVLENYFGRDNVPLSRKKQRTALRASYFSNLMDALAKLDEEGLNRVLNEKIQAQIEEFNQTPATRRDKGTGRSYDQFVLPSFEKNTFDEMRARWEKRFSFFLAIMMRESGGNDLRVDQVNPNDGHGLKQVNRLTLADFWYHILKAKIIDWKWLGSLKINEKGQTVYDWIREEGNIQEGRVLSIRGEKITILRDDLQVFQKLENGDPFDEKHLIEASLTEVQLRKFGVGKLTGRQLEILKRRDHLKKNELSPDQRKIILKRRLKILFFVDVDNDGRSPVSRPILFNPNFNIRIGSIVLEDAVKVMSKYFINSGVQVSEETRLKCAALIYNRGGPTVMPAVQAALQDGHDFSDFDGFLEKYLAPYYDDPKDRMIFKNYVAYVAGGELVKGARNGGQKSVGMTAFFKTLLENPLPPAPEVFARTATAQSLGGALDATAVVRGHWDIGEMLAAGELGNADIALLVQIYEETNHDLYILYDIGTELRAGQIKIEDLPYIVQLARLIKGGTREALWAITWRLSEGEGMDKQRWAQVLELATQFKPRLKTVIQELKQKKWLASRTSQAFDFEKFVQDQKDYESTMLGLGNGSGVLKMMQRGVDTREIMREIPYADWWYFFERETHLSTLQWEVDEALKLLSKSVSSSKKDLRRKLEQILQTFYETNASPQAGLPAGQAGDLQDLVKILEAGEEPHRVNRLSGLRGAFEKVLSTQSFQGYLPSEVFQAMEQVKKIQEELKGPFSRLAREFEDRERREELEAERRKRILEDLQKSEDAEAEIRVQVVDYLRRVEAGQEVKVPRKLSPLFIELKRSSSSREPLHTDRADEIKRQRIEYHSTGRSLNEYVSEIESSLKQITEMEESKEQWILFFDQAWSSFLIALADHGGDLSFRFSKDAARLREALLQAANVVDETLVPWIEKASQQALRATSENDSAGLRKFALEFNESYLIHHGFHFHIDVVRRFDRAIVASQIHEVTEVYPHQIYKTKEDRRAGIKTQIQARFLKRVDHLDQRHAVFGYMLAGDRSGYVLLEQVNEHLDELIVPLAEGRPFIQTGQEPHELNRTIRKIVGADYASRGKQIFRRDFTHMTRDHEFQHVKDDQTGLFANVQEPFWKRVYMEVSAYLSEAALSAIPKTALAAVAIQYHDLSLSFLSLDGGLYLQAFGKVFQIFAEELGMDLGEEPLRGTDLDQLNQIMQAVERNSSQEISSKLRHAHARLFGENALLRLEGEEQVPEKFVFPEIKPSESFLARFLQMEIKEPAPSLPPTDRWRGKVWARVFEKTLISIGQRWMEWMRQPWIVWNHLENRREWVAILTSTFLGLFVLSLLFFESFAQKNTLLQPHAQLRPSTQLTKPPVNMNRDFQLLSPQLVEKNFAGFKVELGTYEVKKGDNLWGIAKAVYQGKNAAEVSRDVRNLFFINYQSFKNEQVRAYGVSPESKEIPYLNALEPGWHLNVPYDRKSLEEQAQQAQKLLSPEDIRRVVNASSLGNKIAEEMLDGWRLGRRDFSGDDYDYGVFQFPIWPSHKRQSPSEIAYRRLSASLFPHRLSSSLSFSDQKSQSDQDGKQYTPDSKNFQVEPFNDEVAQDQTPKDEIGRIDGNFLDYIDLFRIQHSGIPTLSDAPILMKGNPAVKMNDQINIDDNTIFEPSSLGGASLGSEGRATRREASPAQDVERLVQNRIWYPSLSSRTSLPLHSLGEVFDRKFWNDEIISRDLGGWMRMRTTPSVFEGGNVRKSLSWEMMAALSFWANEIKSQSFAPEGRRMTVWSSDRIASSRSGETFSSRMNFTDDALLSAIEGDVLLVLGDLGSVVKRRANMIASQHGVMTEYLLVARAVLEKLQDEINHNPGGLTIDPKTGLAVTDFRINRDPVFDRVISHEPKDSTRLEIGQESLTPQIPHTAFGAALPAAAAKQPPQGASMGDVNKTSITTFGSIRKMLDSNLFRGIPMDAKFIFLPIHWEKEVELTKSQLTSKLNDPPWTDFYDQVGADVALSEIEHRDGTKTYGVLISEVKEVYPDSPDGMTSGYHITPSAQGSGILHTGLFGLPGRMTFWISKAYAQYKAKESQLILIFKLPNKHLLLSAGAYNSYRDALAPSFSMEIMGARLGNFQRFPENEGIAQEKTAKGPSSLLELGEKAGFLVHFPPESVDLNATFFLNLERVNAGKLEPNRMEDLLEAIKSRTNDVQFARYNKAFAKSARRLSQRASMGKETQGQGARVQEPGKTLNPQGLTTDNHPAALGSEEPVPLLSAGSMGKEYAFLRGNALLILTGYPDEGELARDIFKVYKRGGLTAVKSFLLERAQANVAKIREQMKKDSEEYLKNLQKAEDLVAAAVSDVESELEKWMPLSFAEDRSRLIGNLARGIRRAVLGEEYAESQAGMNENARAAEVTEGQLEALDRLLGRARTALSPRLKALKLFLVLSHAGSDMKKVLGAVREYQEHIDHLVILKTRGQELQHEDIQGLNASSQVFDPLNPAKAIETLRKTLSLIATKGEEPYYVFADQLRTEKEFFETIQSFLTRIHQVPDRLKKQVLDAVFIMIFALALKNPQERKAILQNKKNFDGFLGELGLGFLATGFLVSHGIELDISGFISSLEQIEAVSTVLERAA